MAEGIDTNAGSMAVAERDKHDYADAQGTWLFSVKVTPKGYEITGKIPPLGRPLLNLDSILLYAQATILIVDGEKYINGARACLPDGWQITTWHGPIEATNWSYLGSRQCVVWPAPQGAERANALVDHLSALHAHVGLVDVPKKFPGDGGARRLMLDTAAAIVPPVNGKHVADPVDMAEREAIRIVDSKPSLPARFLDERGEPIIIDKSAPLATAKILVRYMHTAQDARTLHHQFGDFFSWTGTHYAQSPSEHARASAYRFLEQVYVYTDGSSRPFKPKTTAVNEVIDALRAVCQLPNGVQAPAWLETRATQPPAGEMLACRNGLLHLPTGKVTPHTPLFFGQTALDYDYAPNAPEPTAWLKFLDDVWKKDAETIATLQDIFGYLLGTDTDQQKLFLLVGPKRSGKGTIGRIINALLGDDAVVSPTLASLENNFGLAPMIGKTVALIADARLSGKPDQAAIAERLLSISGEDKQTIDRKHIAAWSGRLGVRFFIMTNELPRIADSSGALASRFIVLTMTRSFYSKEDKTLTKRLLQELPGILNWALVGWRRVRKRGHFIQPGASAEAIQELEDLGSPIGAFLREQCIVAPGKQVGPDSLYLAWTNWCESQGRDYSGTKQTFGRDLRAAVPGLKMAQPRAGEERIRMYEGVGLRKVAENKRQSEPLDLD